ncbi:MAG: trypsin-like peptidase domain-containing protein [Planctomycetes bacterium]|nr:trypsin-like peptidase domain-containing protein [Planctomycetota bacterium]
MHPFEPLIGPEPNPAPASMEAASPLPEESNPAAASVGIGHALWGWVLPVTVFFSVIILVVYVTPYLIVNWRMAEAQADAEATYLKRRAELKAESEHAEQQLQVLDKRVHLVSLGFREVVRKMTPKVVNIGNYREPRQGESLENAIVLFDPETQRRYVQAGVGTGILVKPGYVLTNHHVVKSAQRLRLTFASGRSIGLDPETVSSDDVTDLAVVRIPDPPPDKLKDDLNFSTEFADSDKDVQVGDFALAIGSPLGLRQTVTQGVISAKGRLLTKLLVELLQTDAAINPGNSGGPLFDQYGRIMGINVAIATDNGGNQGIGFAIPSNTAKKVFEQLVAQGEVPRGYIGIGLDNLPGQAIKKLGLADQGCVLITQVMPKEPGEKAGLQAGDIVVRFNDEPLMAGLAMRQLRQLIADTDPDGQITLEILRDGKRQNVPVKVGKRPTNLPQL